MTGGWLTGWLEDCSRSGRTGVCWDNAPSESFWSTLKTEFYNRRPWPTKHEAATAVGRWLEERYNRLRRHSAIGMMTPSSSNSTTRRSTRPPDSVSTRWGQPHRCGPSADLAGTLTLYQSVVSPTRRRRV